MADRTATREVYNSETGELFRQGDVIPDTEENAILFKSKTRNGRKVVPGIDDGLRTTAMKIAGGDRAKEGAGQDGRKPAPKPKAAPKDKAAAAADDAVGDVEEGGAPRAATSSALD